MQTLRRTREGNILTIESDGFRWVTKVTRHHTIVTRAVSMYFAECSEDCDFAVVSPRQSQVEHAAKLHERAMNA